MHNPQHFTTDNNKCHGVISQWHDDRGFGFIHSSTDDSHFFHISQYVSSGRPDVGMSVDYQLGMGSNARVQAQHVKKRQPQSDIRRKTAPTTAHRSGSKHRPVALALYGVLALLTWQNTTPLWVIVWYVFIGAVTFLVYAKDKRAAQLGRWRTPETTLHILALLGGWGGAIWAQAYYRHKTKKAGFRMWFYVTVWLNLAVLTLMLFTA